MNSVKPGGASLTGPGKLGEVVGRIRRSRHPTTSSHRAQRRCVTSWSGAATPAL
ncbi:TPA: hypothetical protein GND40_000988 [Salmonella enterica subsp. indica]|uniref:Uncharacterized protein n=2 Tax=Salmonella enterica TaxID=28901 RepID=A0A753E2Q2_SALER|nr:hypothetical protein [Salmonella enterica subsp. indica serovar 45:a:e,n,x]HAF7945135.1 hypothetical protein [Salmonella enterica subsp. indica]